MYPIGRRKIPVLSMRRYCEPRRASSDVRTPMCSGARPEDCSLMRGVAVATLERFGVSDTGLE